MTILRFGCFRQNLNFENLSKGEYAIKNQLFKGKQKKVTLNHSPNSSVLAAKNKISSILKKEYQSKCFLDNRTYIIMGWIISVFCFILVTLLIYSNRLDATKLFILKWSWASRPDFAFSISKSMSAVNRSRI